jgi:hypothetical protein
MNDAHTIRFFLLIRIIPKSSSLPGGPTAVLAPLSFRSIHRRCSLAVTVLSRDPLIVPRHRADPQVQANGAAVSSKTSA